MVNIGMAIILVWALIVLLTDWYVRLLSPKVLKRGSKKGRNICLTFDDGPDLRYTPEVLKILRQMHVPATFFLVGSKAEQLPDLVSKIQAEGHQIGCHTFYHRHAYLLSPWKSLATIWNGCRVIEQISKKPLKWFRPPWGALNIFQYFFLCHSGLRIVLWNVDARDWKKNTGAEGVIKLVLKRVKPNSIIVLHDSGGETGAPDNTLRALPDIIGKLKSEGYNFVSLDEIRKGESHVESGVS